MLALYLIFFLDLLFLLLVTVVIGSGILAGAHHAVAILTIDVE